MLDEPFDPQAELLVNDRIRPHWSQAGAIVFVTFRTKDSIPAEVLQRWDREKNDWLARHNLFHGRHWSDVLIALDESHKREFLREFNRRREDFLDSCHGLCRLKRPDLMKIIAESLLHFDGERYRLGDFIVMPNHVHLLAVFPDPKAMEKQISSWLHYTAYRINQSIGAKGHFWQQEPFDHLVRSVEQYEYLRQYIAENPQKARLKPGEYYYRRYEGL
jgi:type I restriction enzyme R subunit